MFISITLGLAGVWISKKEFKQKMTQIIHYFVKVIADRFESITASTTSFLLMWNMDLSNIIGSIDINWSYEMVRVCLSLSTSVLSGYIVNRLKNKYWDKNGNN